MNYLESKTLPPVVPSRVLPWKSLQARFHDVFSRKLSLVVAPAGSGKSTYLYHFFQSAVSFGQRPVWLALDESDNDPLRFWSSVFAALEKLELGLSGYKINGSGYGSGQNFDGLIDAIDRVSDASFDIFFILDNYQHIQNKTVHDSLMFWAEHMPVNMHIALASRLSPPLMLSRLRVKNQVIEIGFEDLFLDFSESKRFIRHIKGIDAVDEDICRLYELTDGWIAGLQLTAAAYLNDNKASGRLVSQRALHHIREYLLEEVFYQQDAPTQDFLLKSSILDKLSEPLCKELAGVQSSNRPADASLNHPSLDTLFKSGLFLSPLDQEGGWYRYHSFFSETLRYQLDMTMPDIVKELYARASAWSERRGLLDDAIGYALLAEKDDRVMRLFERTMVDSLDTLDGEIFVLDEARHRRWLHSLPEERYYNDTTFLLLNAWSKFVAGSPKESMRYIARAKRSLTERFDTTYDPESDIIIEEILLAIEAGNANMEDDYHHGIELARNALEKYRYEGSAWFKVTLLCLLGEAQGVIGDAEASLRSYGQAKAVSMAFDGRQLAQFCSYEIGKIYYQQGQFDLAFDTWQKAIPLFKPDGDSDPSSEGLLYIGMSKLYAMQGKIDQARISLDAARSILSKTKNLFCYVKLQIAESYYLRAQGEPLDAMNTIATASETALSSYLEIVPRYSVWEALLCYARTSLDISDTVVAEKVLDLLQSRLSYADSYYRIQSDLVGAMILRSKSQQLEALSQFEMVKKRAEDTKYLGIAIEAQSLCAACLHELGKVDAALIEFILSIDKARGIAYCQPFITKDETIGELLCKTLYERKGKHALPATRRNFCKSLMSMRNIFWQSSDAPEIRDTPKLSKREEEVLDLMAQGLTRKEIAQRLHISPNTVKTHVRNIYKKLDVNDWAAAAQYSFNNKAGPPDTFPRT